MQRLTYSEFLEERDAFDAAVRATPGISQFCSSSSWALSAFHELNEFDPEDVGSTFIFREGDSWVVLFERSANYYYPFESAWMFQCPLIGPNAVELLHKAKAEHFQSPKGFVIGGVPKGGPLNGSLAAFPDVLQFEQFPATDCMIIDLSEGVAPWLARRSKKFRRTLRDAQKHCHAAAVTIENVAPDFDRIFAIQEQTYKWKDGSDIFHNDECLRFYRYMIDSDPALRLRVAKIDGKDVAYLLGGVFGNTFRGLQMSYTDDLSNLGLGNFLQLDTMHHVAEEESVAVYDLGMFSEYKSRWADEMREFVGCFLVF